MFPASAVKSGTWTSSSSLMSSSEPLLGGIIFCGSGRGGGRW
jgi:hypothetical protein